VNSEVVNGDGGAVTEFAVAQPVDGGGILLNPR